MCGYQFPSGDFCSRSSAFWVQSTISTHNMHSCPHHLARIVREIEEAASPFRIGYIGEREADMRYAKTKHMDKGAAIHVERMFPPNAANGAIVTVKPYVRSK
jgi:hypothetical protein